MAAELHARMLRRSSVPVLAAAIVFLTGYGAVSVAVFKPTPTSAGHLQRSPAPFEPAFTLGSRVVPWKANAFDFFPPGSPGPIPALAPSIDGLRITVQAQPEVAAGTTLVYWVTLTNLSAVAVPILQRRADFPTTGPWCPRFGEHFDGTAPRDEYYVLNCVAAAPVPPNGSENFEMRFAVPPADGGEIHLRWALTSVHATQPAPVTVSVIAIPPPPLPLAGPGHGQRVLDVTTICQGSTCLPDIGPSMANYVLFANGTLLVYDPHVGVSRKTLSRGDLIHAESLALAVGDGAKRNGELAIPPNARFLPSPLSELGLSAPAPYGNMVFTNSLADASLDVGADAAARRSFRELDSFLHAAAEAAKAISGYPLAVYARRQAGPPNTPTWPGPDPSAFTQSWSSPIGGRSTPIICATLSGVAAANLRGHNLAPGIYATPSGNWDTFTRPLLPDESSCATATGF